MYDLSELREVLADKPDCMKFLELWQTWRGDRPIPVRGDVRPEMMGASIANLSILEADGPECFNFRVSASALESLRKSSIQGLNYFDLVPPEKRMTSISRLNNMLKLPCGGILETQVALSDGASVEIQALVLPVKGNNSTDHGFLYATVNLTSDRQWSIDAKFESTFLTERFEYVDIGSGLPDDHD